MLGAEQRDPGSGELYLRDGRNPQRAHSQVHYLKGYFLLRHLMELSGEEAFFSLLRRYVHELNHGRLVHSTEFVRLFFDSLYNDKEVG